MPKSFEIGVQPHPKRRKIWAVLAVAIAVLTAVFFARERLLAFAQFLSGEKTVRVNAAEAREALAAVMSSSLGIEATLDSDEDGLKDWEETLYATNPHNPDTDGDGTTDGDEMRANRDPSKRGPDDAVQPTDLLNPVDTGSGENVTHALAGNLLLTGVVGKIIEGGTVPDDALNNFRFPANASPDALLASAERVAQRDLAISEDNSAPALRAYFDAVTEIYKREIVPHQSPSDIGILLVALERKTYERFAELNPIVQGIEKTAREIKRLPAPSRYADFAVEEVNNLFLTKRIIEIFQNTPNDPIATILVFRKRIEVMNDMAQLHLRVTRELHENGVYPPVTP